MRKNQKLAKFENKKIVLLGLGIENFALANFLLNKKINCALTICDFRDKHGLGIKYNRLKNKKNIAWRLEKSARKSLHAFDLMFRAPGWPINCRGIQEALKMGIELSSPIDLFFELCPTKKIIGVTGTNGKGTTSTLIYKILKSTGQRAWLGGNIGVAPFDFLDKIKSRDWVVLELSSFQLEDMKNTPHIAVITNFTPEHLKAADPYNPNFHPDLDSYWLAKANITARQGRNDWLVINKKLAPKIEKLNLKSKIVYFDQSNIKSRLPGEHNKENIAAAAAAAKIARVPEKNIKTAASRFRGLEHRLELVKNYQGIKFYNDSYATTPEPTITALKSFKAPIILLAGGAEKGSNFQPLAKAAKKNVKFVILFKGKATNRLKKELTGLKKLRGKIKQADNMKEAFKHIKKEMIKGDVVLLSPACASFGIFKNYKERGKLFKKEAAKLK